MRTGRKNKDRKNPFNSSAESRIAYASAKLTPIWMTVPMSANRTVKVMALTSAPRLESA